MGLHIFGVGRSLFFDYLLSFTSALPDIGQKVSKLAYKLPVLAIFNIQIPSGYSDFSTSAMCIRHVFVDKLQVSRMLLVLSLVLFKKILSKLLHFV